MPQNLIDKQTHTSGDGLAGHEDPVRRVQLDEEDARAVSLEHLSKTQ
jgi:hypothetical protein